MKAPQSPGTGAFVTHSIVASKTAAVDYLSLAKKL